MTTVLKIQNGWFRTAGMMYRWKLYGYDPLGVGLNKDALFDAFRKNELLVVEVNGIEYSVDPAEAIEFVRKFSSRQVMRGGTVLGIISKSLLKPI